MIARRSLLLTALLLCAWLCLWPGDTSFNVDEPVFVQKALRHNAAGTWAKYGLVGTKYTLYGPGAIWVYQLLLRITHDPIWLGLIRGILVTLATGLGLSWLARGAALPLWGGIFALLSPYLYIYSRQLWDNNFLIPLVALLLGSYARFMAQPAIRWFLVCLYSASLLFLTHLMSLSVVIPVALHASWFHRRWLWQRRGAVAAAALGAGLLMGFYLRHLYASIQRAPSTGNHGIAVEGLLFPWQGWKFFSVRGLEYFFGRPWASYACGDGLHCEALALLTQLSLPLFLMGVAVALWTVITGLRSRGKLSTPVHMDALALGILVFAMAFNGVLRTFQVPHYHNGSWVVWYYFLWRAVAALAERWPRPGRALAIGYGASLVVALALLTRAVHDNGGARTIPFGTVLTEQVRVARLLHENWSPEAWKQLRVQGPLMDTLPLQFIAELQGWQGTPGGKSTPPTVIYRSGPEGIDAWLDVI